MDIDRPAISGSSSTADGTPTTNAEDRRKYIQPHWVVDCVNAGRILNEEKYKFGKILPVRLERTKRKKETEEAMLEQRKKEMQKAQRKEAKRLRREERSISFSVYSALSTSRYYIYNLAPISRLPPLL